MLTTLLTVVLAAEGWPWRACLALFLLLLALAWIFAGRARARVRAVLPPRVPADRLVIRTTGVAAVFHGTPAAPPPGTPSAPPDDRPCQGDAVVIGEGEAVPAAGVIVEGAALLDESAVSGVSSAVFREAGGDHPYVARATVVLSGRIAVRLTAGPAEGDRLRLSLPHRGVRPGTRHPPCR
jgi:K+-transporting ATPase ATPase B chain